MKFELILKLEVQLGIKSHA